MSRLARHLSFANTCSLLALVVALGTGTAYAANTVRSTDIVNGQVRAVDLGSNAVTTAKIAAGNVRNTDLGTGSVESRVIRSGAVASDEVAPDSLTADDLAISSVGTAEIQTDGVGPSEVAPGSIDGDEVVNDSLTASDLAPSSVGTSEVTNNSLTFSDIIGGSATGAVSFGAGGVANGRCAGVNIGIAGAQTGDAVVFSVQGAMQDGVFLYGVQVTAPNNLRALLCNMSGGAMAAITDLPVRILTFR